MAKTKDIFYNEFGPTYKEINVDDMYHKALLEAIDIFRIRYGWTEEEIQRQLGMSDDEFKPFKEEPVQGQLQMDIKD